MIDDRFTLVIWASINTVQMHQALLYPGKRALECIWSTNVEWKLWSFSNLSQQHPTCRNISRWPNASNMLHPTILRYVPLKCCDRLAGALRAWICLLAGALVERRQVTRRFALETRFFSPSIAVRFSCKVTQSVKSCNFVIFFLFILILNWMRVQEPGTLSPCN